MRILVYPAGAARSPPPLRIYLAFAALALAGFVAQRLLGGGLSGAEVEAFYRGAGDGEALSAVALWEELHVGAFVYGFTLFMLGALLALCPVAPSTRRGLVAAGFVTTLADVLAPFPIRYGGAPGLLRVVTFLAATAILGALLAVVAAGLGRARGATNGHG